VDEGNRGRKEENGREYEGDVTDENVWKEGKGRRTRFREAEKIEEARGNGSPPAICVCVCVKADTEGVLRGKRERLRPCPR